MLARLYQTVARLPLMLVPVPVSPFTCLFLYLLCLCLCVCLYIYLYLCLYLSKTEMLDTLQAPPWTLCSDFGRTSRWRLPRFLGCLPYGAPTGAAAPPHYPGWAELSWRLPQTGAPPRPPDHPPPCRPQLSPLPGPQPLPPPASWRTERPGQSDASLSQSHQTGCSSHLEYCRRKHIHTRTMLQTKPLHQISLQVVQYNTSPYILAIFHNNRLWSSHITQCYT